MTSKKIKMICPFFGQLPSHINLWIKTISFDKGVEWLIFTDDDREMIGADNVFVFHLAWDVFKEKIAESFDFPIRLETPYNLCDFKPFYGYIFSDFLTDCDYWGYCDISDTIFGSISSLLSFCLNGEDKKIGLLGHLSLFKASKESFLRPLSKNDSLSYSIQTILGSKTNLGFDEFYKININSIYERNGIAIERIDDKYFDASDMYYPFRKVEYKNGLWKTQKNRNTIFKWDNGRLFALSAIGDRIETKEIIYVHFQKRRMINNVSNLDDLSVFYITPKGFYPKIEENAKSIKMITRNRLFYIQSLRIRFKNLKKRLTKE